MGSEIVATEVGGVVERAEFDEESLGGSGVEIREELEAVDPLGDARIDAVIEGLHAGAEEAVEEELRLDHRAGGDSESGADVAFAEEGVAEFEEGAGRRGKEATCMGRATSERALLIGGTTGAGTGAGAWLERSRRMERASESVSSATLASSFSTSFFVFSAQASASST